MKKFLRILLAVAAMLAMQACTKQCVCVGYDGSETVYTEEEVDAQTGNCSNMIIQAQVRFYSLCEWE